MLILAGAIALIALLLAMIVIRRAYTEIPSEELKRRARNLDHRSEKLYKVVAYDDDFSTLYVLLISLISAGAVVLLFKSLEIWEVFLVVFAVMIFIFGWLINVRIVADQQVAVWLAPILAAILNRLHPVLNLISRIMSSNSDEPSRIYQTEDLLRLLEKQVEEPDNRIPKSQLNIVAGALTYADKLVMDVMVPRRSMVFSNASDAIGPILMEELHNSGHSRFPVVDSDPEKVVGTLYLRDIINAKHGGLVKDVMSKDVYYVHEENNLQRVLQAFLKTKHHMFIVINRFEEIVGVITIEDVLEQIIGKQIVDEFDRYDNLREVATKLAIREHTENSTEVIE